MVEYLERVLAIDAEQFGREMFEQTSDVSEVSAEESSPATPSATRSAADTRSASPRSRSSAGAARAQGRPVEGDAEGATARALLYALMVTDVLAKGTELLVAGDAVVVARAFGVTAEDSTIELPGRDEPQERGRAEAARDALTRALSAPRRRSARARAPRPTAARAGSTRACPA